MKINTQNWKDEEVCFEELKGLIINKIELQDPDALIFHTNKGVYYMAHHQDCCENVEIETIDGELNDLLNTPILQAEESTNSDEPKPNDWSDSFTWTFYKLATIKGYVTIRWLGESNGYYSEEVGLYKYDSNNS